MIVANEVTKNVEMLVKEIMTEKPKIDILPNTEISFEGEAQVSYFLHARQNMHTVMAHLIMNDNQDLRDIKIQKQLGVNV